MATTTPTRTTKAKKKTDGAKRSELKSKVEAAQKRNADRSLGDYARDAGNSATSFVKEHPITTLVGGLAVGALIASFIPGPGKRLRKQATARSAVLAGALGELALTYGTQFLQGAEKAANTGRDKLGGVGEVIGESARSAANGASTAAETAGDSARDLGKAAVRTLKDLRSRMTH